jgi:hypothetical protein
MLERKNDRCVDKESLCKSYVRALYYMFIRQITVMAQRSAKMSALIF